jgi:broad-specificity NMP kinase
LIDLYDESECYRAKDYLSDCDGLNKTFLSKLIIEYGLHNLHFNDDVEFNDFYLAEHLDLRGVDLLTAAKFCKKSANSNYIYERHLYDLLDGYINDYD